MSEESAIPADWEADPYWDDGAEDDEFAAMLAAARAADGQETDMANDGGVSGLTAEEFDALMDVPSDDEALVRVSREWVAAMIADMGVCPFTTSAAKAGLPLGEVHYPVSRVALGEEMYRDYWHEVALLESAPARSLSTTLLITPHFGLSNMEAFMAFTDTLNNPLEPLRLEDSVQLVFFHPQWVFRDGRERQGADSAGNFARRSPFPMINILRTPQVRIAQRAIPTGRVYQQNEATLDAVGAAPLQRMLIDRDWEGLRAHRVDRRSNELYDTAQRLVEQYAAKAGGAGGEVGGGVVGGDEGEGAAAASAPPAASPDILDTMDITSILAAVEKLEEERQGRRDAAAPIA